MIFLVSRLEIISSFYKQIFTYLKLFNWHSYCFNYTVSTYIINSRTAVRSFVELVENQVSVESLAIRYREQKKSRAQIISSKLSQFSRHSVLATFIFLTKNISRKRQTKFDNKKTRHSSRKHKLMFFQPSLESRADLQRGAQ